MVLDEWTVVRKGRRKGRNKGRRVCTCVCCEFLLRHAATACERVSGHVARNTSCHVWCAWLHSGSQGGSGIVRVA